MNIIACVKTVKSELVFQNLAEHDPYTINPYDLMVLQKLAKLKETGDHTLSSLSMGPESTRDSLVRCLVMGVDEAYWLLDRAFAGSDTVATTYILAEGIRKIGNFDLIVCGAKAVDGETGQVVLGLAKRLNIPCIIDVEEIIEQTADYIVLQVDNRDHSVIIKVKLPAIIAFKGFTTVSDKISLLGLKKANRKPLNIYKLEDLQVRKELCGLDGSKTKVMSIVSNLNKKDGCTIEGSNREKAEKINSIIQTAKGGE